MNEHESNEERKEYEPPRLEEHGTVEEITEALVTAGDDGIIGSDVV